MLAPRSPRTPRPLRSALPIALVACLAPVLAAPVRAANDHPAVEMKLHGADGSGLTLTLDDGWLGGLISSATGSIDCKHDDTDAQTLEMLSYLDRSGRGSRYRFTDRNDGDVVVGRRDADHLDLEVTKPSGKHAHVVLPWAMAECMLGRPTSVHELLQPGHGGKLVFQAEGEDGGSVKIQTKP
jgi:hypothetical protein